MMNWRLTIALSATLLAACQAEPEPSDRGPKAEPLVIYASAADESSLTTMLAAFTRATAIPTTLKIEDSAVNTNRVINDEGSPPADVLITTNVADIWRASDEGALRPIESDALRSGDARFHDPDGFWLALSYQAAVIVYAENVNPPPSGYADLAAPEAKGMVCLSAPSSAINRTLIAMLIDELGRRPAELMVRGWLFNRAALPFASDAELLAAMDAGTCRYGIVASSAAVGRDRVVQPMNAYFDVQAAGIARHARYPESAQRLFDWLLKQHPIRESGALSDKNVGIAGWLAEEAELLAERASYR